MSILNKIQSYLSNQPEQLCPIHEYAFIEPQKLTFSAAVREACESNMCGRYGKCWTCPPSLFKISSDEPNSVGFTK